MSSRPLMVKPRQVIRAAFFALSLSLLIATSVPRANAQQDFTLTIPGGLITPAVDPGGTATATIDLQPVGSFAGTVTLSCAVPTGVNMSCAVSPTSEIPPALPSLTVTTSGATNSSTPAGRYPITVTGTSGSSTPQAVTVNLSVQPLTEDYTLSVQPTTATPSPVNAGLTATSIVTVTPIGSYTGDVTLACLSVSNVVEAAPYCSFQYPDGNQSVTVGGGASATATLTITTLGPKPNTQLRIPRAFYALWLLLPGLALIATGGSRKRGGRMKIMGPLLLIGVAASLLLLPACSTNTATNNINTGGLVTPSGTYTFTLTGTDQFGNGPSNTSTNPATVQLTVTN